MKCRDLSRLVWQDCRTMKLALPLSQVGLFLTLATGAFAKTGWEDNYEKGLQQAKTEKKIALVDFTGSDWCTWCMKLDKEVFSKAEFKDYAKQNLVLVEVDFPNAKPQSKKVKEQNQKLQKEHSVRGYPTIVVLNADGKKVGELGYMEGGPKNFLAKLDELKSK